LIKLLYLALRNISKRWTLPIRDWKAALNRFTILFEGRLPQLLPESRLHKICTRSNFIERMHRTGTKSHPVGFPSQPSLNGIAKHVHARRQRKNFYPPYPSI
ncbi:MAG: hypothetical protein DI584_07215, partial [Stenotrophomonas sp.]